MATSKSPERKVRVLKPQFGPQEKFLATPADICIYGGAAGGGKTYGLLLSALRYKNVKGFGCTIFRKNYKQIFAQGGLWDEAQKMYHGINGAQRKISDGTWSFRDKDGNEVSKVSFAHIERSEELDNWQGAQICEIGFDELTHFSEEIFFYMLSRNRSTCGVRPFVRATCNPDADSWVAKFISWWIDQDTGYPIPERSGLIRYMIRRDEVVYWADTREELWERFNLTTPEEKNENSFLKFDKNSSILENFIKNFWSQLKEPTHFRLIRMTFNDYRQNKQALKDLAEGKKTDAVKEFLKRYEIIPKVNNQKNSQTKEEETTMAKKQEQTTQAQPEQVSQVEAAAQGRLWKCFVPFLCKIQCIHIFISF